MSSPSLDRYKGFDINVQAMRRAADAREPADAPRHFDIIVNLTRQAHGANGKSGHVRCAHARAVRQPDRSSQGGHRLCSRPHRR